MTLRRRFMLHYALVITGLVTIGIYTERQLDTINGKKRILEEEWNELDQVLTLEELANESIWALETGDAEVAAETIRSLDDAVVELQEYQEIQEADNSEWFATKELAVLHSLSELVVDLGQMEGGRLESGRIREVQRQLERALNDFRSTAKEEMAEAIGQIHGTEKAMDALMWIWLIAMVVALSAVALTLRSRVTKPLRLLREGAAALRRRDFKHRVPVTTGDEMGEVAGAFNAMSNELESLYNSLEERVAAQAVEIQRSMAELERSMRLATIGTLAAGVAHEINNPLEAISVRTDGMRRRAQTEDTKQGLELVATEVARCRKITRRLLDFARKRRESSAPGVSEEVDIGAMLRETADLLLLKGGPAPAIDLNLPQVGPQVWCEATALRQVFLNLLMNAVDATENGGSISIRANLVNRHAVVEICDTGEGIDPADLPHIFDPFYTTKEGRGTGLGLSVSHGIVLDHGGTITIHSDGPGCGTTARVSLPNARSSPNGR